jgi:hypothetical protein
MIPRRQAMRLVVNVGETFTCPICQARYVLESEDDGSIVVTVPSWAGGDRFCRHLDPEILPVTGDAWEVYFTEAG